jgi:Type IV secretion system pilin
MTKNFTSKKSLAIIFMSAFVAVFLVQIIAATVLFFMPAPLQAASPYTMNLEVPIPTLHGGSSLITFTGDTGPIAEYIKAIYAYAVGAVGIVAAVVLMIGGLMWITAGGNASSVSEAKSMITASLTGLVLVLTSYLLLNQVNPSLVNLSSDITTIKPPEVAPAAAPASISNQPKIHNCNWGDSGDANNITNGLVKNSDETKCQSTPKSGGEFTACMCSYLPLDGCSWISEGLCGTGKTSFGYDVSAGADANAQAVEHCGSNGIGFTCCCAPVASTSK